MQENTNKMQEITPKSHSRLRRVVSLELGADYLSAMKGSSCTFSPARAIRM
jgi:hypothetical protein